VAVLIKYEHEWWRLVSPIFLHAGVRHIISNVGIQLRVGGYLELVFGRPSWVFIYFSSGIYGNMLSCIFLPDSVGIGSSGAVLGMLTAWIVWILFRWNRVPRECKGQRNCQLMVVSAAVALTLAFSFTDYGECLPTCPPVCPALLHGGIMEECGVMWRVLPILLPLPLFL
jgi:membrane associated rhomboid family serine protease